MLISFLQTIDIKTRRQLQNRHPTTVRHERKREADDGAGYRGTWTTAVVTPARLCAVSCRVRCWSRQRLEISLSLLQERRR